VHPNDELAKKRHNSFGKTEMWYVMQADEGARLIVGFKEDTDRESYTKALENNNLLPLLKEIPVKKGDVFLLETGTVHAIGAGILLAEIQQTSDVTYRLYDWDRVDANGKSRALHTELALDAINFKTISPQQHYQTLLNDSVTLVDCPYFKTELVLLADELTLENSGDSFLVLMCVEGSFELTFDNDTYSFALGQTVLVPAAFATFQLHGKATLLKITV
jgi:mannose-6-phosphate isomerase